NHKRTIAFTALEDNPVTFQLLNPGSTRTTAGGLITSEVYVPQSTPFAIGFETREGAKIKRRICRRAEVQEVGEITEAETALTTYAFTVAIYPDGDGLIWTDIMSDPASGPSSVCWRLFAQANRQHTHVSGLRVIGGLRNGDPEGHPEEGVGS